MKFLNKMDGASKIITDPLNQFVTEAEKLGWDGKTNIPVIIGTQSATTASWTGTTDILESLTHGTMIAYWLPRTSSSNVTLNLTLKDGSATGPIFCYFTGVTRLSTQYAAGNFVFLIYLEGALVTTTSTTGWHVASPYINTTYSVMTEAELNDGTATSARSISAQRLQYLLSKANTYTDDKVKTDVPANAKFTDTTYGVATTSANGLMSGTDKTNLNSNTSARHSHTNKITLDKLTEVNGELKYNGETVVTKTSFTWAKLKNSMTWAELVGI